MCTCRRYVCVSVCAKDKERLQKEQQKKNVKSCRGPLIKSCAVLYVLLRVHGAYLYSDFCVREIVFPIVIASGGDEGLLLIPFDPIQRAVEAAAVDKVQ